MASTVKHLRSSTASKRPTASGLAEGQLAINTASGTPGLFLKDSAGTVVKVGPVHVGASAPNAVPAGSAGNSTGELWVNNSTTIHGLNYYTGSAFVNLTPSGTTTVAGLVELATNAETQTGTDTVRAVTPSGLQSKVSNSTSTTSSTTIASSTAVKAAYDLADAALPKAGGRVTGNLEIGPVGSLSFEGSSDDSFETTLAVVNPTADRTITLPDVTGTVITTGDSGTVTSAMIADLNIVNADINASAAIALSKLATGALPSGITVASANIVDGTIVNADINASAAIADTKLATISTAGKVSGSAITSGTIDTSGELQITNAAPSIRLTESDGAATHSQSVLARDADKFQIQTRSSAGVALSSDYVISANASGATDHSWRIANTEKARLNSDGLTVVDDLTISDKIIHASDPNTAIRFPAADTVSVETSGVERIRIRSDGNIGIGGVGGENVSLFNQAAITGAATSHANFTSATVQSGVTTVGYGYRTTLGTAAAAFTTTIQHFAASQGTIGSGSTVSNQFGFIANTSLNGATNNYGFYGSIASGAGRWNFYGNGTAPNYFAGDLRTDTVVTSRAVPSNSNTSATATASSLLDGLRTGTPTGNITLTLPTGADMDAAFQDLQGNQSFQWSVINLAAATHLITVTAAATGHTVTGNTAVAAATSGRFLTRKTAANTFASFRIA